MLTTLVLFANLSFQDTTHIRVLTINDLHGAPSTREYNWSDGRLVGGAGVLAATMDSLEAECDCTTFRLGGGDLMQGTLASNVVWGASIVEVLDAMALDATAIGNHEFDWGRDILQARIAHSDFPWLSANIFETATERRPDWSQPYGIIERDGIRIGLVGYTTSSTPTAARPSNVTGLLFAVGPEPLRDAIAAVQAANVDFTIIVTHAATTCRGERCGESIQLANQLEPGVVDLIVGGHDHQVQDTVVNGVPIIEGWSTGRAVGVVDLYKLPDGTINHSMRVDTTYADKVTPNPRVAAVMAGYEAAVDSLASRVIAHTEEPLERGSGQYPLGNLIADAIRVAAGADVSLNNNGGIRARIDAGDITYGELFQVHPFGNLVVSVTVTGEQLLNNLEHSLRRGGPGAHFSGLTATYDPALPAGQRLVEVRLNDGNEIDPGGVYTLATPDFVSEGGDGYPLVGLEKVTFEQSVLDAIISFMSDQGEVMADSDVRIVRLGG
jgi:2',3'-cyclic-nucleotide 2'-phosphodiesterase/3'-nucleotidase/5'-nucleotidase